MYQCAKEALLFSMKLAQTCQACSGCLSCSSSFSIFYQFVVSFVTECQQRLLDLLKIVEHYYIRHVHVHCMCVLLTLLICFHLHPVNAKAALSDVSQATNQYEKPNCRIENVINSSICTSFHRTWNNFKFAFSGAICKDFASTVAKSRLYRLYLYGGTIVGSMITGDEYEIP